MKKILFILTIVILLIAGYVFANNNLKEEEKELTKIKVVTTIFPYYDFTRQLSDDNVEITMLLKPGVDMHNYDPTLKI
ncbi:MAG: metal ABC transporter substrate-binding protein [Bacilli bacterium]|nr:metal ABC transporter substrate-binding protein [Bacilli bacterium]